MAVVLNPTGEHDIRNWLVEHALKNVWCRPYNDHKLMAKPCRLSSPEGELFGMTIQEYPVRLPIIDKWFHVYQLGKLDPQYVGIEELWNGWSRLDRVTSENSTLMTLYNEEGIVYPQTLTWIRKLDNGCVLLALEDYSKFPNFGVEQLYVRFYDGQFKRTSEYSDDYKSYVVGGVIRNNIDLENMVRHYSNMKARFGEPSVYVNGQTVKDFTRDDVELWDFMEIIHDGLVDDVHYFNVKDLQTFSSTLDSERKYLIHPPKRTDLIRFVNDVEIEVFNGNTGRHYNQHRAAAIRQVTHSDYAIPSSRIQDYITNIDGWDDSDNITLKVMVRRSGMERPLIYEQSRIHELYKLPDEDIVRAMVGMNSTMPEWKAATLENSRYVRLMAASRPTINKEWVTDVYGYNATAKYAADTPQKPIRDGNRLFVNLPGLLARGCTVYEYDDEGLLLGFYKHSSRVDDIYNCHHDNCALAEAIVGHGDEFMSVEYDATDFVTRSDVQYRFYTDVLLSGVPSFDYEDITDTDKYSIDANGKVHWNLDLTRRRPTVVSDEKFLAYTKEESLTDGVLKFDIVHNVDGAWRPLLLEPESVEIWMNGRVLVPTVDMYLEWPRVVVCNKEYLKYGKDYNKPIITVRCRGLSDKLRLPKAGFVVNGKLSNNDRFDVRDDKVVRIAVGGGVIHRDDVVFSEDMSVGVGKSKNGAPYFISDATVPLRGLTSRNTYELRDEARALDTRVEDYLSVFVPQAPQVVHNPIDGRHETFSPIMNIVIRDMLNNDLNPMPDGMGGTISDSQFDRLIEPYLYLLKFDPIRNRVNTNYVECHPHAFPYEIELEPIQYSFVERINYRLLMNQIVLNKLLKVKVD